MNENLYSLVRDSRARCDGQTSHRPHIAALSECSHAILQEQLNFRLPQTLLMRWKYK